MATEVIVALLSMLGTLVGSLGGVLAASRLTNHRLEELEKRVNRHNQVIERTYRLEEQIKVANHRIADLEDYHK